MHKYIVGKNQKHLVVSEEVHELVKMYSKEKGFSMVEATYELLRIGFAQVYDLNMPAN
jgi:hypothetical protein